MTKYKLTYTDTVGGSPNYGWVRRETFTYDKEFKDTARCGGDWILNREVMKKAKALVGLTGVKGRASQFGNGDLTFKPYNMATILFVDPITEE